MEDRGPLYMINDGERAIALGSTSTLLMILISVWGFWIISPWWSSFSSTPTFSVIRSIDSTGFLWGGASMLIGCIYGYSWLSRNTSLMTWCLFVSGFFWLIVSLACAFANFASTAGVTYLVISMICFDRWKLEKSWRSR